MMNRQQLEAEPNWQATFERPRVPEGGYRFTCIMRTIHEGLFYWHTPDYEGLYQYGATRVAPELQAELASAIPGGFLRLVAGTMPTFPLGVPLSDEPGEVRL
jgi:hypothetical protein